MLSRRNVITSVALVVSVPGLALAQAQPSQPLPVLASFSILGDLVREIGGPRVTVTDLVGPDQDSHGFEPGPQEARRVAAARVVVVNGLGFEPYLDRLLRSAGSKVAPVTVTAGIQPLAKPKGGHGHNHGHSHGKEADSKDPHAWQSVTNAKLFARAIAAALAEADAAGRAEYEQRLGDYLGKLDALQAEITTALAAIPAERRLLVTTHDSFRYFAAEFGLKAEALQGISAESEPSAADMARIIRQLKALKAPAVFLENVTDPRKIQQIARETGAKLGGTLYSDALSLANGPAPTYIEMMRHNARQIAAALKP